MRVAFVGLGLMGSRMAANLVKKGFEVTVHNRTRARADALIAAGARLARTPGEAASGVEIVCTCVANPPAMRQVFTGPDGIEAALHPGQHMVDFSTLAPDDSLWLDAACRARGVGFLESPVTGSRAGAEAGTLVMMCGGTPEVFAAARPVLQALGSKAIHVGAVGAASQVKLIGNLLIAHMMEGLSEGAALARKAGIPLEKVLEVVQSSGYVVAVLGLQGEGHRPAGLLDPILDRPHAQGSLAGHGYGTQAGRTHAGHGGHPRGLPAGQGPGPGRKGHLCDGRGGRSGPRAVSVFSDKVAQVIPQSPGEDPLLR